MNRLTRFEPKYNCYVYNKSYAMGRKAKQKLGKIEDILEAYNISGVEELEKFLDYCAELVFKKEIMASAVDMLFDDIKKYKDISSMRFKPKTFEEYKKEVIENKNGN